MAGEESVNTSWVNHFDVQDTEISGLDPDLYEFRTVGKNGLGESPASDITEGRPLPGVAGMCKNFVVLFCLDCCIIVHKPTASCI